jgi:lipopolysaccharide export system ATP-binding protein
VKESWIQMADAARADIGRLAAESLSFAIGSRWILSDVSVRVAHGEIVGLLGPDGSGKTCLFELLAGLVRPSSGAIFLNGMNVTGCAADKRARQGLSYLPEEPSLFRELTVEDNIQVALNVSELDAAARSIRRERLLQSFKLQSVRKQTATSLSGGERRRCEVARALASHAAILLLDEPFRGLDPMSIADVANAVVSLRESDIGVLISDYDLHDLVKLVDRAYVLHEGCVIFSGTVSELLDSPAVRHLYLGDSFVL